MKSSPLNDKSLLFAIKIVKMYGEHSKNNSTLFKQLLRSGTSVGANLNEAVYGNSKQDFISKIHISLKEANESIYWLKVLKGADIININEADELLVLIEEIKAMLIASINTAKSNKQQEEHHGRF